MDSDLTWKVVTIDGGCNALLSARRKGFGLWNFGWVFSARGTNDFVMAIWDFKINDWRIIGTRTDLEEAKDHVFAAVKLGVCDG